ncbi:carboxypeptidase regulatory-like domain-containing protein [Mucilaginibacter lappiensis]|uniref:carboxypeptidase regulatory-like domain-containing protein n=1 Tax=Mucilaginibacter lappiensis TaxID=354630 RepID=UPI003D1BB46F
MIKKVILYIILLWPLCGLAQSTITGRVLSQADKKPIANASIFLSNASVGTKTTNEGTFILSHARPGKYDLVISIIGFEKYSQTIIISNNNISLPDIYISPKTIALQEVKIKFKSEPNRQRNYEWFKDAFLGQSPLATECKILNPEVLDLAYDEANNTLTASSYDFLEIENQALGYRIKYLLNNFIKDSRNKDAQKVHFDGSVLFEEMKGTPQQQQRWQKLRLQVYEGSMMHFLRSAIGNRLDAEGFRVLQYANAINPKRPPANVINEKMALYRKLATGNKNYNDSVYVWAKKAKLPKTYRTLMHWSLKPEEFISSTAQLNIFALGCDSDALHITYNKSHHFPKNGQLNNLNNPSNREVTVLSFNQFFTFFDSNGAVANPNSVAFEGAWGKSRTAELLPSDYESAPLGGGNDEAPVSKNIVSQVQDFNEKHVAEKAYLHFDKPYYTAGDTIYFKAYVTLGAARRLSDLSGVLHVDLINTTNKIDQTIKLQLKDGMARGDFTLPDSLPKGCYRVRAYTQWMRNEGDGNYFDQSISIVSPKNIKVPVGSTATVMAKAKPDIQFFPEGGTLVAGIRSKIAFKAIGAGGLGINVKGVIADNDNKEVATFGSTHLGMGYFYLTPQEGKTYTAKVVFANGSQNMVNLPKPEVKGIVLSVNNDSLPKATVRIMADKACYQENKNKDYMLLIYSGGIANTATCRLDSPVISLDILKRRLHTGVATVTLFSPAGDPLCERLLFVQNYDQLGLALSGNKTSYAKREKVNIKLQAKTRADEPSAGHFSVSVIDENKVPVNENTEHTILTDLLLTSDLKGYVEQPSYYFTNIDEQTAAGLDLVMLTHGFRRFEWKPLLYNSYPPITYQPEKALEINGTTKSLFGKPLPNATVSLISKKEGSYLSQVTDNEGRFRFSNLVFDDSTKFILQAINVKGQNNTQLNLDQDAPGPAVAAWVDKHNDTDATTIADLITPYQLGKPKGIMLKEVKIKDKALKRYDDYRSSSLSGPGHADQVFGRDDLDKIGGIRLSEMLAGRLKRGLRSSGGQIVGQMGNSPLLTLIDGVEIKNIDDINQQDVETIELLLGANAAIYGPRAAQGALLITTRQGGERAAKDMPSKGILPITPQGFYKAREFYSPKYDNAALSNQPDLRTTIYWNPELVTDQDGNASFNYYNADGQGTYRLVIEGIDENGNLGRLVYRYRVN